jgi:hypothetical protein
MRLALRSRPRDELLVMPRKVWLRMLVSNDEQLNGRAIRWPQGAVGLQLHFAMGLPGWHVRYDPVGICGEQHAGLTGGIVLAALNSISQHAPSIAGEFDAAVAVVRAWDVPTNPAGTLQSFSDPTLPRVMGINVPYNAAGQPQICPFCFTWFGHELGHTKSYLIETILHVLGHSLTTVHGRITGRIPAYGRSLPVRTLLQVPYTHFYEWSLMMQFLEGHFAGLPWEIGEDPFVFADQIQAEIEAAFDRIARDVPLSPAGRATVTRLQELYGEMLHHWERLRARAVSV